MLPGRRRLVMSFGRRSRFEVLSGRSRLVVPGRCRNIAGAFVIVVMFGLASRQGKHDTCRQKNEGNSTEDHFKHTRSPLNKIYLLPDGTAGTPRRLTDRFLKSTVSARFLLLKTVEVMCSLKNSPSYSTPAS